MELRCIFDVERNKELKDKYEKICDDLRKRFHAKSFYDVRKQVFEEHHDMPSYARNTHTGKIKDGVKLSELEVAMICDGGYSHFGGSSVIGTDGTFRVVIYTD